MTQQSRLAYPSTLSELLAAGARTALICPDDGLHWTFERLATEVDAVSERLVRLGVKRGNCVALVLPNGPEVIAVLLGIAALGAAAAPLNPAYTKDEYVFYFADLEPRLLILPAEGNSAAQAACPVGTPTAHAAVDERGRLTLSSNSGFERDPAGFDRARPDDIALLLHTSGTTSRPKQVPLLHRNLMASARSIAVHYALTEADVSGCAMPLFHVHGLVGSCLSTLLGGGTVIVPRRLNPSRFLVSLVEEGITWFSASPTIHKMILDRSGAEHLGQPAQRLRFVRSCSAPLPDALLQRAERFYDTPMLDAYGMTEASHQICANPPPPGRSVSGSVGPATGVEVSIIDPAGNHLNPGQEGEVVIRGASVTPGYLKNPEANEHAFTGGWFRTGDRGVINVDGYVRLEGRLKEMILRGGENISPYEVEEVLLGHPAVADAVCFGVPDEKYGEEVAAAVVLADSTSGGDLARHCRRRLAAFKVPKEIRIVDAIPRTATGKVQRSRMASAFVDGQSG